MKECFPQGTRVDPIVPQQFLFELNPAESILAPFHDERIAVHLPFCSRPAKAGTFRHESGWDSTRLLWDACPGGEIAGHADLQIDSLPDRFDQLIFCLVIPLRVEVSFKARLDGNWEALGESIEGEGGRAEVTRPLKAGTLTALRIIVRALEEGPNLLLLHWWGVGDSALLRKLEATGLELDGRWDGLLRPEETWGNPEFARGLLFSETDLPILREKANRPTWRKHFEKMEDRARRSLERDPLEDHLGDFLPWCDHRFLRAREHDRKSWMADPVLCALVGLVREDKALIRHALHTLMCFVHTRNWCQSAESRARGCTWDQRCFLEEAATTTCALLYDWLYFALTDRARDLVRTALWDKGLAIIQRDMVKWEYLYSMNQGPWFCRARILAGLVLEPAWPRVRPYTEQALADLQEGMARYILSDGGVDEGVAYFNVTLRAVLPACLAYARVRKRVIHDILPPQLAKSGQFIAIMSSMTPGGALLDGDNAHDRITGDAMAIMAALYPDDVYTRMAAGTLLHRHGETYLRQHMIDGPFAFIAAPDDLPEPTCVVPTFGQLPETGHLTSRRSLGDGTEVRIHLAGCKANASHTHFDKGAVTLELDRTPALIDRGVCRYDDQRSLTLKRTELHNVLAPESPEGTPISQFSATEGIIPSGRGDSTILQATIDLTNVWRGIMVSCIRRVESLSPMEFTIHDEGEFGSPHTLIFHLHTREPWTIDEENRSATLETGDNQVVLHAPWATEIRQYRDGIDHRLEPVWHLECRQAAGDTRFKLSTSFAIGDRHPCPG
ncbi:MAG: hypothetical protein DRP71_06840 [Verrucomicrobia bacterium]|nr:MAG: hypothetical protein DRP71_06840 [Verrucomicrobiota bacterium]